MELAVVHSLLGRVRIRYTKGTLSNKQIVILKNMLMLQNSIDSVVINSQTFSILIYYHNISENDVLSLIKNIEKKYTHDKAILKTTIAEEHRPTLFAQLATMTSRHLFIKLLPLPIRQVITIVRTAQRVKLAIEKFGETKKLQSETLDATSLVISILNNDYNSASSVAFLLNISEVLEEYAKKTSADNLKDSLLLQNESVQLVKNNEEFSIDVSSLVKDDVIVVRKGEQICVDGTIVSGEAMINETSLTGESKPQEAFDGRSVYAGTMVEEGEVYICVKYIGNNTKISKIFDIVSDSNTVKTKAQKRSENIADTFVPYNFLIAILTYIFTGDIAKATSTIMVDYSCAMKLAAPIAVFSSLRDASQMGHFVKGGKFLENLATASTIVFDKTGTLTKSEAQVGEIIPFGKHTRHDVLKLAACLEEHFPHSLAKSVVNQAKEEHINHREEHTKVEYIVAHGIVSTLKGKSVAIGSEHFVLEDLKIKTNAKQNATIEKLKATGNSLLYLVMDKSIIGVISIEDPIREETKDVISELKDIGIKEIVMLTGDSEPVAKHIASIAKIENYRANCFPEHKIEYIKSIKSEDNIIAMVGDGINDSPALSAADVGIVMHSCGSDIAKEAADIVLSDNGLSGLVELHILGDRLLHRIHSNNKYIITINSALILASIFGLLTPATASLFHNTSTAIISANAMRKLV